MKKMENKIWIENEMKLDGAKAKNSEAIKFIEEENIW